MRSILVLALALFAFPSASAAVTGSGTVEVGANEDTYYVHQENGDASVWQETNGVPGLQRDCADASCVQPDARVA